MNDEHMQSLLETWFEDTDPRPPDVRQTSAQVMAHVPRTRQRRRPWSLPGLGRGAQATIAADTTEFQPSPNPATDGHTPTVIGRTQLMFSPTKALVAGALVFGIGGALLIAQPLQQEGGVPGAETEPVAPVWVTGTIQGAPSCSDGQTETDGDVRRSRDVECSPQTWTSSDPRLSGEVVRRWNDDIYQTEEGTISVDMDSAYLRNDGGGWVCSNAGLLKGEGMYAELVGGPSYTFTCTGNGGHEGLSAILVSGATTGFNEEFVGLIFSGDFPPLP